MYFCKIRVTSEENAPIIVTGLVDIPIGSSESAVSIKSAILRDVVDQGYSTEEYLDAQLLFLSKV